MNKKHSLSSDKIKNAENDVNLVFETFNDPEAFGKIMTKYSVRITKYLYRIIGTSSFEINDLLQEVFIKVYKNLKNFNSSLSFSSWIYRIAHNEAIDYIRKTKIRPRTAVSDDEEMFFLNIPDDSVNIIGESNNGILKDKILNILALMKEKYRTVLILRYLEEKDYHEISNILKIPLGTVATLVHRAKDEFKKVAINNNISLKDI